MRQWSCYAQKKGTTLTMTTYHWLVVCLIASIAADALLDYFGMDKEYMLRLAFWIGVVFCTIVLS